MFWGWSLIKCLNGVLLYLVVYGTTSLSHLSHTSQVYTNIFWKCTSNFMCLNSWGFLGCDLLWFGLLPLSSAFMFLYIIITIWIWTSYLQFLVYISGAHYSLDQRWYSTACIKNKTKHLLGYEWMVFQLQCFSFCFAFL